MLFLAIMFIIFREIDYSQQNYSEDASTTRKIPLKQSRIIEIVKWHQPICVIPGKDVSDSTVSFFSGKTSDRIPAFTRK